MNSTRPGRRTAGVGARLDALTRLVTRAEDRLPAAALEPAREVLRRAADRFGMSAEHTVVILGGATGVGKSSLFNSLVGIGLSPVAVRRPTTTAAIACVWEADRLAEARPLLERLGVEERRRLTRDSALDHSAVRDPLGGLVLIDLPDHDSAVREHQAVVDQAVGLADVLVWVTDPQKYADAAWHDRYLKALAHHSGIMIVVLNQIDRLPEESVGECVADLARLMEEDGLTGVPLIPVSVRTGAGIEDLRRELTGRVSGRQAAADRLSADVDRVAERLAPLLVGPGAAADADGDATAESAAPAAAATSAKSTATKSAATKKNGGTANGTSPAPSAAPAGKPSSVFDSERPSTATVPAARATVSADAGGAGLVQVSDEARAEVMEGLRAAVGVSSLAEAVSSRLAVRGMAAVSSPLRALFNRRRGEGAASANPAGHGPASANARTVRELVRLATEPMPDSPGPVPVDRAALDTVLSRLADAVTAPLPEGWGRELRGQITGTRRELADRIDAALAACEIDASARGGFGTARFAHIGLLVLAAAGIGALFVPGVPHWLGPLVAAFALLGSGALDIAARAAARQAATDSARVAVGQLSVELAAVAQDTLFTPIADELSRYQDALADFRAVQAA